MVPSESADAIAALLQDFPEVHGVAMEGAITTGPLHPEYGEWFSVDLTDQHDTTVTIYFPKTVRAEDIRARIQAAVDRVRKAGLDVGRGASTAVSLQLVDESSWENAWKEHFRPIPVGRHLLIVPAWEAAQTPLGGRQPIYLEPGMAFGTGTHETTQLCLRALEDAEVADRHVLDVGCGTGVLAIAAARLGAARVQAVDIDPVAVGVAAENARRNGVAEQIEIAEGNLLGGFAEGEQYDVVVANILRDVVILLTPQVASRIRPGGVFISSGYITEHVEQVRNALETHGFVVERTYQDGGWAALMAVRAA